MEIKYIWLFLLIYFIFIITSILISKFNNRNKSSKAIKKIANTTTTKKLGAYQKIIKKYHMIILSIFIIFIILLSSANLLSARIVEVNTEESYSNSRDIMFCLDVSLSMDEVNNSLLTEVRNLIKELEGERIGISIFNSSTVLAVPLTDDYNYLDNMLVDLANAFDSDYMNNAESDEYYRLYYLALSGTIIGATERGSSLVGDGLASCVYNFGDLETDRSRSIIFTTDNELSGTPIVTLTQAAQIASENNIRVHAIYSKYSTNSAGIELKEAAVSTGGTYYDFADSNIEEVVNSINEQEKTLVKGTTQIVKTDNPEIALIILLSSFTILCFLFKKVKL